jgi:hypothetical protein
MYTVHTTIINHNVKTHLHHTVVRRSMTCFNCRIEHVPIYRPDPRRPGVRLFEGPSNCCECGGKLGCWKIVIGFRQGAGSSWEYDPKLPELYRTKKEAVKAKKEKGL